MAVKIKPLRKFTTGTPTTSDMVEGEIAVNTADKKVFMRDNSNNIIEVGAASSLSLPIGGGTLTGDVILNSDSVTLPNLAGGTNEGAFQVYTSEIDSTNLWDDINSNGNNYTSMPSEISVSNVGNNTTNSFAGLFMMAGETSNNNSVNAARIGAIREGAGKQTALGFAVRQTGGDMVEVGRFKSTKQFNITGDIELEGASFITTLTKTAPTAARTITFPDITGTVITTGNLSSITSVGTLTSIETGTIRITGTGDASLSSTTHGFQVGATSGTNVIIDGNEIMARNNSASSGLFIQNEGGSLEIGATGANLNNIKLYGHTTIFDGNLSLPTITGDGYEAPFTVVTSSIDADNLWDDINSDGNQYSSMPSEIAIKNIGNNTTNSFAGIFMMPGETSNASFMNAARIGAIREGAGRQTAIAFATRQNGGDMVEVGRFKSTKEFNLTGDIELEGANFITTLTKTAPTATRTITFPDANGQVVLADGAIDTDSSAEIGRAHVGHVGWNDYAGFSHVDQNAQTTYSLLQKNDGKTYLNAATGQTISQRINNVEVLSVASTGIAITGTLNTHTIPSGTGTLALTSDIPTLSGAYDLNGGKLTLDADADSSIHASTDDVIDFEVAGNDVFKLSNSTAAIRATPGDVNNAAGLKLERNDTTPSDGDLCGYIFATGHDSGGSTSQSYARMDFNAEVVTSNSERGSILMRLIEGSGGYVDYFKSDSNLGENIFYKDIKADLGVDIIFEGTGVDNFETTLTVTNPTQDNTITLPDATGTVALTSDISTNASIHLKPHFVRVSSAESGSAAVRYIKVATINSSTPSNSNSTFVFRILLEGRAEINGASQFRVHIRTADTAAKSTVVVEQEHSNRHTYFGIDSFIFFHNSQSNSEFWVKIPNNNDTAFLELFAKLEVSAPVDVTFVSGHDDVTIHTSQSWTTSAPTGTNEVTAEWIKKRFDSIIFEGSTTNTFETFLEAADPGADRTITLPDATGTVMLNVVEDTSPQLGGNLDVNGKDIVSTSNANIDIKPNGSGFVKLETTTGTTMIKSNTGDQDTDIASTGLYLNNNSTTTGSSVAIGLHPGTDSSGTSNLFSWIRTTRESNTSANFTINVANNTSSSSWYQTTFSGNTNTGKVMFPKTISLGNADTYQTNLENNNGITASRSIQFPNLDGTLLLVEHQEHNSAYGSTSAPRIFKVTVATQTAAHPYNGDGSTDKFSIDGIQGAALTLHGADNVTANSEYVYRFDQADGTNANHPLRFYLDAAKTTAYTTGVTTNGTPGQAGAYTQIAVTQDTPQILYYQCSSHAYMGNYVIVPHSTNIKQNGGNITFDAVGGNIQLSGDTGNSVKITGALETTGNIELGNASDTTISRSAAGTVQIEGNTVLTLGNSDAPTTTTSDGDADFVLIDDGGTMKKITPANLGIGSGGGGVTVQDEGGALSTTATTLNFVGAGVTASGTGAVKTITISGGGGGISTGKSIAMAMVFG